MSDKDPGHQTISACERARTAVGVERYGAYAELERLTAELPDAAVRLAEVLFSVQGGVSVGDATQADYALRRRLSEVAARVVAAEFRRAADVVNRGPNPKTAADWATARAGFAEMLFDRAHELDGLVNPNERRGGA